MPFEMEAIAAILGALAVVIFRLLTVAMRRKDVRQDGSKFGNASFYKDLAAGEVSVKQAKQLNEDFMAFHCSETLEPEADAITEFTESEPEEEQTPEPASVLDEFQEEEIAGLLTLKPHGAWQSVSRSLSVCFLGLLLVAITLVLGGDRPVAAGEHSVSSASPGMATSSVEHLVLTRATCTAESMSGFETDNASVVEAPPTHGGMGKAFPVKLERQKMHMYTTGETSYYRSAYYGTVNVGDPAVPFTVVFDTGSGHLVLPSMYCHSSTCRAHRRYRRSDSRTAKDIDYDGTPVLPGKPRDQITVSFGTGQVTGVFVEDIVCLNAAMEPEHETEAGLNSTALASQPDSAPPVGCMKLRMIAATDMSEDPFREFQFDGVLGLGLQGLSQTEEFNFVEVAAATWGGLNPHIFAVFLAVDEDEESEITFGGWDDARRRDAVTWNDVDDPEQGHWTVRVKSIRVDGEEVSFCESGCKAVVDTGTSLLSVPSAVFPELYEMLKHPSPLSGFCTGVGPQLQIELEGTTITLGPEDYARTERTAVRKPKPRWRSGPAGILASGSKLWQTNATMPWMSSRRDLWCKPTLMTLDLPEPLGPKLFILGEPVLRKYYTVYDAKNKRVGFSRARHRKGRDSLPRVPKSMFDMFRMQRGRLNRA